MRLRRLLFVSVPLVLGLAACQDSSTAPAAHDEPIVAGPASLSSYQGEEWTTEFTIHPNGNRATVFGIWNLNFPANAVCDPATSGYGEGTWDQSCKTLTSPITITATVSVTNNRVSVNFSPDIRFAPSNDQAKWVTISTPIFAPMLLSDRRPPAKGYRVGILFSQSLNSPMDLQEVLKDPTLRTKMTSGGIVWRRIKHFTSYHIVSGEPCEPDPNDPYCVEGPPPGED